MTTYGIGPTLPPSGLGRGEPVEAGALARTGEAAVRGAPGLPDDRVELAPAVSAGQADYFAAAKQVRQTDQAMGQIDAMLTDYRQELGIVKLYPPYPIDEPRRAALIRQLLNLKAQIDRVAGTAQRPIRVSDRSGAKVAIVTPPAVGAGAGGLALPDVVPDASGPAVDRAIAAVDTSRAQLSSRRAGFAADAQAALDAVLGGGSTEPSAEKLGNELAGTTASLARPASRSFLYDLG